MNTPRPLNVYFQFMIYFQIQLLLAPVLSNPVFKPLKSKYPTNPIEDPQTWAWGRHPDNGLDYKAKDSLEVSVCLANPQMINTAKCVLPLDVCLANPQYLPSLGCKSVLTPTLCATMKEITLTQACQDRWICVQEYEPSLFMGKLAIETHFHATSLVFCFVFFLNKVLSWAVSQLTLYNYFMS